MAKRSELTQAVENQIVILEQRESTFIATALNRPITVVNSVLEMLEREGDVVLARPVDASDRLTIVEVSDELLRRTRGDP